MKNLRPEEEIVRHWRGGLTLPVVSICCITYNHELYIEDALEGFLIQDTDFPFEILVHDDASTDRTADIIREYEKKYPRLIKPIFQVENQYRKGKKLNPTFNFPRARGDYLAFCEGDDYWVSPQKLRVQVELMRKYGDVNLSFHPAKKIVEKPRYSEVTIAMRSATEEVYSVRDVILGGGGFMPTASLMIKRAALMDLPDFFYKLAPVGDYYLQVMASLNGALFFPEVFTKYRFMHNGSWSRSQLDSQVASERFYRSCKAMKALGSFLPDIYLDTVKEAHCGLIVRYLLNSVIPLSARVRAFNGESLCMSLKEFTIIGITSLAPKYFSTLLRRIWVKMNSFRKVPAQMDNPAGRATHAE